MWIWDLLEKNIELSYQRKDKLCSFSLRIPSEEEILKVIGDGEGIPTSNSDKELLERLVEFGKSGKFILLFHHVLPYDTDEEIDFARSVLEALYSGKQNALTGKWQVVLEGRSLNIQWEVPAWYTGNIIEIDDSQRLCDVFKDWYIDCTD